MSEALKLGIEGVIVTCNIENIASKKIIEKNNGKLLGTIYDEEEDEHLYKYIIMIQGASWDAALKCVMLEAKELSKNREYTSLSMLLKFNEFYS